MYWQAVDSSDGVDKDGPNHHGMGKLNGCSFAHREELDALMARMGSLSQGDDEEGCCASRAPARSIQGSLQRGATSEATAEDTAGPSTLLSLPVIEDEGERSSWPKPAMRPPAGCMHVWRGLIAD